MAFSLILRVRILLFIFFSCGFFNVLNKHSVVQISATQQPFGHAHTLSVFYSATPDTDDRLSEYDTVKAVRCVRQETEKRCISTIASTHSFAFNLQISPGGLNRLPAANQQLHAVKLRQLIPKHHFW